MKEIWKDVKGYEGIYKVSNKGRLLRTERVIKRKNGSPLPIKTKITIGTKDSTGYRRVTLMKNGKEQITRMHRIVAENFIANPNNLPQVNHIDGNKLNNEYTNLEWVTGKQNIQHAFKIGLHTTRPVYMIDINTKEKIKRFSSLAEAGRFCKTKNSTHILECCKGKRNYAYGYI